MHKALYDILATVLQRSQVNHLFGLLHPSDRLVLLEQRWAGLFLLLGSYWSIDLSKIVKQLRDALNKKVSGKMSERDTP